MATFKCYCGKVLSNSHSPNNIQLVVFTDYEWEQTQEKIKYGEDVFDVEPKYDVWMCPNCSNVYVFDGNQVIKTFILQKV